MICPECGEEIEDDCGLYCCQCPGGPFCSIDCRFIHSCNDYLSDEEDEQAEV